MPSQFQDTKLEDRTNASWSSFRNLGFIGIAWRENGAMGDTAGGLFIVTRSPRIVSHDPSELIYLKTIDGSRRMGGDGTRPTEVNEL
jgi:hypothetical protein